MFNILILLLLGIASGYVFRNSGFLKNIDKSVSATILASFGTAGSLLASYFAYKLLFGKKRKGGEK